MKYYIIAGEPSGDLHGSNLIKGLKETDPQAEFRFWGGDLMIAAAADNGTLVRHYKEESVMGFTEVLKNLRRITRSIKMCRTDIQTYNPDALILIDYPGFNLRMAKFAKSIGIKTLYYIAPKVWAWKEGRVKKIKAYVDKLFVIFPFEIDYFKKFGISAFYGGNPLMDSLQITTDDSATNFRAINNLPNKPIIALVAGSRKNEILYNLPTMIAIAKEMEDYQFVITGVEWLDKSLYNNIIGLTPNVSLVISQTQQTLSHSAAALVTSGTATLETALMQVPQVVCYRAENISMWIAKKVVKLKWISLVNIVMNREVVTELIQENFSATRAIQELKSILPKGIKRTVIEADYKELSEKIGPRGASLRVAQEMYQTLNRQ